MGERKHPKMAAENAAAEATDLAIYERWLGGTSQAALASEFRCSQQRIAKRCRRARDRIRGERGAAIDAIRAEQSVRLEIVRREAMAAWDRSKQEKRPGYPALEIALRAEAQLAKLWGSNSPEQTNVNHSGGLLMGFMSKAEIEEQLARRVLEIKAEESAELAG